VIEVPEGLARSPRFWHDEAGRAWLERLPRLVDETCERWGLRPDGQARHGSHALVLPVTSADGPAALRLTPPDERAADSLSALRFWAGPPVVRVLRADEDGATTLLERLDPDRRLSARPPEEVAEVLGGLVAALATDAPPADAPSTADEARSLGARGRRRWHETGRRVPAEVLGTAVGLAADLTSGPPDLAVDGDLHADQVLGDQAGEWRVVDPVLMRGDPAYDLARAVWTTVDRLRDADAILRFTDRLVGATGLDRSRAEAWLIVRTVDYWLWCLEAGLTEDPARCARFVAAFSDE
jgi:streptomycin 6-kinase